MPSIQESDHVNASLLIKLKLLNLIGPEGTSGKNLYHKSTCACSLPLKGKFTNPAITKLAADTLYA